MHAFLVSSIAFSIAMCALGLAASRLPRLSAATRHWLLSASLVAPCLAIAIAAFDPPNPFARRATRANIGVAIAPPQLVVQPSAPNVPSTIPLALWATGSVLFLSMTLRSSLRWTRIAKRATPFHHAAFRHPRVRLGVSGHATEPMVVGVVRPVVLLPVGFAGDLHPRELESVFAHELEHIRRGDNATALLHELVCALFWFDPLHWIARRRLLDLRERACDERVLDLGCEADAYAAALAKCCHAAVESPAVACMSGFHIRERMDSIMTYTTERTRFLSSRIVRWSATALVVAIAMTFALLAPAPPVFAGDDARYRFDVEVEGETVHLIHVTVFAPDGTTVLSSRASAAANQPVDVATRHDGKSFKVTVTPDANGNSIAVLEVRNDRGVLQRDEKTISADRKVATAEPLSLNLKDADVHKVMRMFEQITGKKINMPPDVSGTVTIDVRDMPWDEALARAVAPLGLTPSTTPDGNIELVNMPAAQSLPRVGGEVKAPKVLTRVNPVYPADAKAAGIHGVVIIETTIDEFGNVQNARVLKPLPMGLDLAALDAVRQWKFEPATKNGRPVAVLFNLTMNFQLE